MFTGLIEALGTIESIQLIYSNITFWIKAPFAQQLKVDESVSHNGICLTVEKILEDTFQVTAVKETIEITSIGNWKVGDVINLERAMKMNDRLGGHIVQGHVDTTAVCSKKISQMGSTYFTFNFDGQYAPLLIEKGSICINGISLTCFNVTDISFSVAIIPYTFEHTNIQFLQEGQLVNIEFDLIGKYILRMEGLKRLNR